MPRRTKVLPAYSATHPSAPHTSHSSSADVMAVLDERAEAVRAKDIDRLMSLYSPDIVYFDVIPPHQFIGAADVCRNFLRWFDEYQGDIGLETHDLDAAVSEDVAFAHKLHPDSGTRRNGQDVTVWVRSTVCLQLIDGRWLITHEHISFPIIQKTGAPSSTPCPKVRLPVSARISSENWFKPFQGGH